MTATDFDCIVVGARCAGAPLATHLARAGLKVLVLDAATLPSDQPMSTHVIQTRGMDFLDELGLGDTIRGLSPALRVLRMQLGDRIHDVHFLPGRSAHCVRRFVLDPILEEAAARAGAEIRERTRVTGLVRDGGRIRGVEVDRGGRRERITGRIVVGADGRHSTIAKLVGAEEYFGYDNPRGAYSACWPAPAAWTREAAYAAFDFYIGFERDDLRFIFHTDGDLLLIGTAPPNERLRGWSGDHESEYLKNLQASPIIRPLVDGAKPVSKILGLKKLRYFFRRPVGPGWALVGDAGLHKDPTPGHGITDALRDARALATAIIDGSDQALERYWRQRDVDSFELFKQAEDLGSPAYVNPVNQLVWEHMKDPWVAHRLALSADRQLSPYAVVPTPKMLRWMAGAVLRGRFDVLGPFFKVGRRNGEIQREAEHRKRLLEVPGAAPS